MFSLQWLSKRAPICVGALKLVPAISADILFLLLIMMCLYFQAFNPCITVESSFYRWHWEVAFTYTSLLGDIVLYANNSLIQKRALLGTNRDITSKSFLAERHKCHEKFLSQEAINDDSSLGCYVGLFDLTFFHSSSNQPLQTG